MTEINGETDMWMPAIDRLVNGLDRRPATFEQLVGAERWATLPAHVRRRFSADLSHAPQVFVGRVDRTRFTRLGWLVANLAKLIGSPLPTQPLSDTPSVVTVVADGAPGAQVWTRQYSQPGHFPQDISSRKRFAGPTGLEEQVGGGIVMALNLEVDGNCLVFVSDHFVWRPFGRFGITIRLPQWIPVRLTVRHRPTSETEFRFEMKVEVYGLGTVLEQIATFKDTPT